MIIVAGVLMIILAISVFSMAIGIINKDHPSLTLGLSLFNFVFLITFIHSKRKEELK